MPTIKGPIVLGKNKPIPKEILKKVKVPFEASNWKSKDNSSLVKGEKLVEEEKKPAKKKAKKYTKKELKAMEFNELREIGDKLNVKGRSKRGLIKDILAAQ